MPLNDDDLLMVGRVDPNGILPDQTFKITWAQLKAEIQALPFNTPNNDEQSTSS